jgi:hypothetical protein
MIRIVRLAVFSLAALAFAPAAQAGIILFNAFLDGPSEDPPVPTPGTGMAELTFDTAAHTLRVEASFADLSGATTVAHIHAPTTDPFAGVVGVAVTPSTLPGFPAGVTSGTYDVTLDLTDLATYTGTFLALAGGDSAGAEALLLASLQEGRAYFNIHTSFRPSGEIRGFFQEVPEPEASSLLMLGLLGLLYARRRTLA